MHVPAREFCDHQVAFLDLIARIVLVSSGRAYPLHACGVKTGAGGVLFLGPSGVGKSTMAVLWRDRSNGACVLGDERIWLRRRAGGEYWIYGTPLPSKVGCVSAQGVPLRGIFFLRHGRENRLRAKGGGRALTALLEQGHLRLYRLLGVEYPLDPFVDLVRRVPCYDLDFVPDDRVLALVREALAHGGG